MEPIRDWRAHYVRRLQLGDAFVVGWAVVGAHVVRFGHASDTARVAGTSAPYFLLTLGLCAGWWALLGASGSREPRILGAGADEYKRVVSTSLWIFGLLAITSYAFQLELARGYVGVALPAGILGLLAGRWILRQHLVMERVQGDSTFNLLLVGGPTAVTHLVESLRRFPGAGYRPVAAYLAGPPALATLAPELEVPVVGYEPAVGTIMAAVRESTADAVAMTAGVHLHPEDMRHLGWELAAANVGLIVAPALTDIAGPRIHTQPVAGLPLIHVTAPTLDGGKRAAKRVFDLLASGTLLLVSMPVMLLIAGLVRLDSKGPVLFRQERVGIDGEPFVIYKFRSMTVGAEGMLPSLAGQTEGNGVLFKMKLDPRVTRIGAQLRRFSLDELPQLFNVFRGSMSLVGPRPPLPAEVDSYEKDVRRRLLVKPGLTGLWQVSGRSNLSWQDSVRLDLYYVENWSMAGDILILLRTARAVLKRDGAY